MKILFVITGLDVGGAEVQLLNLIREQVSLGNICTVCSLSKPLAFTDSLKKMDVKVYDLGMTPGKPTISGFFKYLKILRIDKPDVVHSHMIHANILVRFARLLNSTPIVNTAHSVYEGAGYINLIYKITKAVPSVFTHVSKDGYFSYLERNIANKNNFLHVDNGVKLPSNSLIKSRNDPVRFISVGRLEDVKNHKILIEALSKVDFEFSLDVLGEGSLKDELLSFVDRLNLNKKVSFHGNVNDVTKYLRDSDCFLLTSNYEGLPIAALEALSMSLPIISTNVGDMDKLVFEGENGYLVPPGDINQLIKCLLTFKSLSNCEYLSMRRCSFDIVSKSYSITSVTNKWLSIYKSVI